MKPQDLLTILLFLMEEGQTVKELQPGQSITLTSLYPPYIHLAGVGVNITGIVVQRPG